MPTPAVETSGKLRVGVAGVGYLGRFHARIYAAMPDVELVGVADSNEQVAREVAEQHGCRAYTDARELIDHDLPLPFQLCRVRDVLPVASAADAKMLTNGRDPIR